MLTPTPQDPPAPTANKMRTSFDGLVRILATSLYPEADVFVRELVQNAHDSIQLRRHADPDLAGTIRITADPRTRTLRFEDNGRGMDRTDIQELLTVIGRSGTGEQSAVLRDRGQAVATIGQFGIGLLSAFVVAERLDVYTRKVGTDQVWHWSNTGGEDYGLQPAAPSRDGRWEPGTTVVVTVAPGQRGHLDPESLRKIVRKYADFLPFPILVNGQGPVNAMHAPWHQGHDALGGTEAYREALDQLIRTRYGDRPLHLIPVDLEAPAARGVLYVSDRPVAGLHSVGLVDIYQGRMSIRPQDQELLPDWARFVRGLIDSPDLHPTAARDNVLKDATYLHLREALGRLIIDSLLDLARTRREGFQRLCECHHYHLKGMALHHDDLYAAVIDHLPFATSQGPLTLPELRARQRPAAGRKTPIYCFADGDGANQFQALCEAQGMVAVNAGRAFDGDLLRRYVREHDRTLELRQLDHRDNPDLYRPLAPGSAPGFRDLESGLQRALERVGIGRVRPQTRRFAPATLSAVLLNPHTLETQDRLAAIGNQPFVLEGLADWAQELGSDLRRTPVDLYLNADNPLIQGLAARPDLEQERWQPLLVGVYTGALLYAQQRISPEQTRVLYDQSQRLLLRALTLEGQLEPSRTP